MRERKQARFARRREDLGACLSEFPLALILLLFLSFFPACNLVMFCSAYLSLQHLTQKTVDVMSMSESREKAETSGKELLNNYRNPMLTMLHKVHFESNAKSCQMEILVNQDRKKTEIYGSQRKLPEDKKPSYRDNREKILYTYRLRVSCSVDPIFNMSGIPIIGQAPVIAAPSLLEFCAQAPIENVSSLEK